jgi:glycine oxidase
VALELAERGAAVTLVEKDQPGVGATGASAGMLAPQYETSAVDAALRFGVACRRSWPSLVERIEALAEWEIGLRTDGMLVANRSAEEEDAARRAVELQRGAGLRGEILDPAEAQAIHHGVAGDVHSWLWLPDESQLDAQRLAVALGDAVKAAGARLRGGVAVRAVTEGNGRVTRVVLDDGSRLAADAVVVAAGAWSGEIDGLPRELPVRPLRGQILRLLPEEPLPWTLVTDHAARYLVPRVNGTILVGSTMEDVGFDDSVTEDAREALAGAASGLIPALGEARVVEAWAGLRPISRDRWPVLGPDPELTGLHYATGHGRNGILFAPLGGKAVAELVLDGETEVEWEAFGVERFG